MAKGAGETRLQRFPHHESVPPRRPDVVAHGAERVREGAELLRPHAEAVAEDFVEVIDLYERAKMA